ncbi:DciA family protein [Streptomyces bacillaris]|uniref:DciA family protein n=1 Tax=Streptomyces bacillaris TaxID=68179 RepID=UPI003664C33E
MDDTSLSSLAVDTLGREEAEQLLRPRPGPPQPPARPRGPQLAHDLRTPVRAQDAPGCRRTAAPGTGGALRRRPPGPRGTPRQSGRPAAGAPQLRIPGTGTAPARRRTGGAGHHHPGAAAGAHGAARRARADGPRCGDRRAGHRAVLGAPGRWRDAAGAVGGHRPELAGHVAAVSYDADSGRLTVCPESSAWATKARLEQTRNVAAANEAAGRTAVRALRILPPGAAPVPADAVPADPAPAAPTGPARTRETACEGYRRALAAHQEVAPPRRVDPDVAAAVERQTAMRELSHRVFPERRRRCSRPPPGAPRGGGGWRRVRGAGGVRRGSR